MASYNPCENPFTCDGNMNLNRRAKPKIRGRNTIPKASNFFTVLTNRYTQFPTIGISPISFEINIQENKTDVAPHHIGVSFFSQTDTRQTVVNAIIRQSKVLKRVGSNMNLK